MASSTSVHIAATSSSPAGSSLRLRSPIAWYRTAQCPTIPPAFTPLGIRSTLARYSPYVCQSQGSPLRIAAAGMSSTDSIISARYARSSGRHGANVTPQFPITTVVTPCQHDGLPIGSHASCASRCVWMSTKPGVTTRPSASISSTARSPCSSPIAEIRSPTMPTSAKTPGPPVPSTIKPSRTITSNAVIYPPPPRPVPRLPAANDATADRGAKTVSASSGVADCVKAARTSAEVDAPVPHRRGRLDAAADLELPLHRREHRGVAHVVGP